METKRKNTAHRFLTMGMLSIVLSLAACGNPPQPTDLEKAMRVVRTLIQTQPLPLQGEDFFPDKAPSDFVKWFFSIFGTAVWAPPTDLEFSGEELQLIRRARGPMLPDTVTLSPHQPDPAKGWQVVLVPDDAQGMIVLKAYADPSKPPVLVQEVRRAGFQKK
ncbi:MAG: hypothetical protein ACE5ER_11715 [Nitrospinaceae bacterium]